jgi:hypothetical protein
MRGRSLTFVRSFVGHAAKTPFRDKHHSLGVRIPRLCLSDAGLRGDFQ